MTAPYSTGCTQICNQGRDCTCVIQQCQSAAPEGGNVWFVGPEPEDVKFNVFESIAIYCVIATLIVISLGLMAAATQAFYQQFFN